VHWGPSKTFSHYLGLPFLKGRELLVVHIEELEKVLEDLDDLWVNPWTILKFDDQVECINHREMLETEFIVFKIVEKHADDSYNLLFIEEVQNLGNMFDYVKFEVSEAIHCKVIIRQDPQCAANIICNLSIVKTVFFKNLFEDVESHLVDEDLCEFIDLKKIHKAMSIGLSGEHFIVVSVLKQVPQEVVCIILTFLVSICLD